MLRPDEAKDRCAALLARAKALGADAGDAVYLGKSSQSVEMRLGALEGVDRSEAEHLGLRVFVGKRSATVSSSALDPASLDELAERAVLMARGAPEDPFAGLAPEDMLMQGTPADLDLVSDAPGPEALRQTALEIEDAARAIAGVTNSEGASASYGRGVVALVTSHGFAGAYEQANHSRSGAVVAGQGSGMERGMAWRSAHHGEDLLPPAEIGRLAGSRAVERLNPASMKSGQMPVVFDPRVGRSLIGHLVHAISGSEIARGASFLADCEGHRIFAPGITIADDPLLPRGMRSHPFDGEGLPAAASRLVEDGVLAGWLLDSASARKLGRRPTGHAARGGGGSPGVAASNVTLLPGRESVTDMIADIADGVWVTELIGQGFSVVTGDYSRGASGFRIVDGQVAGPVAGITIAANMKDMFARMRAADDLEIIQAINVPTLRIDGMTVAGD
ncbi:TldD/PmbA family protein [Croceicoccus marinus]|uniref:Modulator protein n=1 Tax=Croceicoccus marinus TaxID=450378 RepID=A0A1Z1FDE9_9SPHN|nr:TldD/PmbA family protein [Croceicoccus marinus]ARU16780.1 modulator protein [Croceicoccus marinus]